MIDLNKARETYEKYLSNYDLNIDKIKSKVEHSYRVAKISRTIAKDMNLDEEKQQLAELIGLLHDIGRFKQYETFKNYKVISQFDHGDYGAELLKNEIRKYIETSKYDSIIIKAVKNHNKYKIEGNLTDEELFFSKLIRDADKIDILYECENIFWKGKEELINQSILSNEIYKQFKKQESIKIEKDRNYNTIDDMLITLAFTYDINFKESYKCIKEKNYINKIIQRFNFKNLETKEKIKELINLLNKYIENRSK